MKTQDQFGEKDDYHTCGRPSPPARSSAITAFALGGNGCLILTRLLKGERSRDLPLSLPRR
jgi:hypothetical protein